MKDLPDVDVDLNNSRLTITYLGYDNVSKGSQEKSSQVPSDVLVSQNAGSQVLTECPKIYRKSVLNLLKYRFAVSFRALSTSWPCLCKYFCLIKLFGPCCLPFPGWNKKKLYLLILGVKLWVYPYFNLSNKITVKYFHYFNINVYCIVEPLIGPLIL